MAPSIPCWLLQSVVPFHLFLPLRWCSSRGDTLLLTAADLLIIVLLVLVLVGFPDARLAVLVLAGEIVTLLVVAAALGESAGAGGELGADSGVLLDPVGQSILAVLDNGLGGLVSVVGVAGLARGDGSVVNELEEVLAEAGDDSKLLAVLTEGIELVGEGSLQLLTGDVGELGLGDERLSLGTDELLLKDDNLGAVGLLVLELGDLVGDLLLA
jgi:hypothetical protein